MKKINNSKSFNHKKIIIPLVLVILIAAGLSYAWFSLNIVGTGNEINLKSKGIKLVFTDTEEINATDIEPDWEYTKTFIVKNESSGELKYTIYWEELTNGVVNNSDLVYEATSTDNGGTLNTTPIPKTPGVIMSNVSIDAGVTQTYTMKFKYKNDPSKDQSEDMGKELHGKISLKEGAAVAPESCFQFSNGEIKKYYSNEGNSSSNPACPSELIIPSEINGETVTKIGNEAFSGYDYGRIKIKDVVIPNTVTTIDTRAFYTSSLTNVTIPDSVTSIGNYAFAYGNIENVKIPSNLTIINQGVFSNNNLSQINIPSSITRIEQRAFQENKLTSVNIPNGVTFIGLRSFSNNKIKSMQIPSSVSKIENAAFNNNQMSDEGAYIYQRKADGSEDKTYVMSYAGAKRSNIIIPTTIKHLGSYSFESCSINSVTLHNAIVGIYSYAFAYNNLSSIDLPDDLLRIDNYSFYRNNISSVHLKSGLYSVNEYAFGENNIRDLTIDEGIEYIQENAFNNNRIETLVLPNSLKELSFGAFSENRINNVTFGSDLTSIGERAFNNNQLTEITIPNTLETIGPAAFAYNYLDKVILGRGVNEIGESAFGRDIYNSSYNPLTEGITNLSGQSFKWGPIIFGWDSIGDYEFADGIVEHPTGNISINPGYTVTDEICFMFDPGQNAIFGYNDFLSECSTDVVIPEEIDGHIVKNINPYSFFGKGITSLVLPNKLERIEEQSFPNNYIEGNIIIPNSVTFIGDSAFENNNLTSAVIGRNVEYIGYGAFRKDATGNSNPNLTTIRNLTGNPFEWTQITGSFFYNPEFVIGPAQHQDGDVEVTD